MTINVHLVVHNVICIISVVSTLGLALFTFLNGPRKALNIAWSFMLLCVVIFVISHVVGVSVANPDLSRDILMFNLSIFFLGACNIHATLALLGKDREKRGIIIFMYASATVFVLFFILFPDLFLLPSVPKMYFPNYYNPGILNWVRVAFLYGVCVPYMVFELFKAYRNADDRVQKAQYKYFMLSVIIGYAIGSIPNFLVYGIPIDPAWGMAFAVLFSVPFVYGAVRFGLFNVKVIAQQAFFYSLAVGVVGGLIVLLNYSNILIATAVPSFPGWITSFVSAVLAVSIAIIVWSRFRQTDILKYEFVTIVTHKFRTPLTTIKWASENIANAGTLGEAVDQSRYIQSANMKLIELTNLLMNTSDSGSDAYSHVHERVDLSALAEKVIGSLADQILARQVTVEKHIPAGMDIIAEVNRIEFVVGTLLENAVNYSPIHGGVSITLERNGGYIVCTVRDQGIGMTKDELSFLFSKFYRGNDARKADTEGMGIGLFIAKDIVIQHDGKIWAESDGPGKGSSFLFSLPAAPAAVK